MLQESQVHGSRIGSDPSNLGKFANAGLLFKKDFNHPKACRMGDGPQTGRRLFQRRIRKFLCLCHDVFIS
jgi:hypothetical protein